MSVVTAIILYPKDNPDWKPSGSQLVKFLNFFCPDKIKVGGMEYSPVVDCEADDIFEGEYETASEAVKVVASNGCVYNYYIPDADAWSEQTRLFIADAIPEDLSDGFVPFLPSVRAGQQELIDSLTDKLVAKYEIAISIMGYGSSLNKYKYLDLIVKQEPILNLINFLSDETGIAWDVGSECS